MKFAKEASEQEELARKAALALQQASSKAQIARNKMKRIATEEIFKRSNQLEYDLSSGIKALHNICH